MVNVFKVNNKDTRKILANIYLLKVNNRNTRKRCEICSKLTIQTPERRQKRYPTSLDKILLWTYFKVNVSLDISYLLSFFIAIITNQWTGFYIIETSVMKELMYYSSEAWPELPQTSKMESFAIIVNGWKPLLL